MTGFFSFFAERNLLAYLITIIIILLGSSTLYNIKRDSFPSVEFGEIIITTTYPGASPEDVELKVTNELEKQLKEVTGIKRYMSWSMENVSTIYIVLDPDVKDEEKVVRDIREAVSRVTDLPDEVTDLPLVTELSTSSFPMIEVGLSGKLPYHELRELSRQFQIKLENVTGVARVERYGYRAREIRVEVSPKALLKNDISLAEVVSAIQNRNIRSSGGTFESYTSEKNIVTLAQFRDPQEVNDVIVQGTFEGPVIKIKDLAEVIDDFEAEKVRSRINGESAISFIAFKTDAADIIETVDAIKRLIEKEKNYLPAEVKILSSNDASTYVRDRFSIVTTNGLIGLTLVMIVLTLFLNLRIAFWVALGIPIAILGVIFLLPMFGSFLDSVTMTAMVLVIGIIVDDAIIISESIYQQYENGATPVNAAVQGLEAVLKPVITTILTTVIVFIPLFFMPGMLGKFVYVIPLVIILALCVSLIESTLALPAHLVGGLKKINRGDTLNLRQRVFHSLRKMYRVMIEKLLRFRYLLVTVAILILAGSIFYAAKYMDFILFPSSSAERFVVFIETPIGTSLQATSDYTQKVEEIVSELEQNELDSFVTRIGTFGDIGSSERENNSAVFVSLTPYASRIRTADEIVESLREKTKNLKGIERIRFMIDSGGPPVGRPIMVRVAGVDDTKRKQLANDVEEFLKTYHGSKDIERDDKVGKEQVEVKLNYERLARVGSSVADVARSVRIAFDGEVVTSIRYGDEDVEFRVIFPEKIRKEPEHLLHLMLPNKSGHLTKIEHIAKFEVIPGPANLYHYKSERAITISGDVDKNITTPIKVSQALREHFNVDRDYPGMQMIIGGEAEESEKSINELFFIMGVSLVGIYFLLILLFNSLLQPLLVLVAIPFGIIGVIVGFSFHNEALGFLAMTGIIGLAGVVVNDSLVLVNHVNVLCDKYPERTLKENVIEGAAHRLRAILLTTVSTVAGLLPLAYGIGGADPYMSPMALALGWGLLFSTPLTLILIPCLYMIGDDINSVVTRKTAKHQVVEESG